MRLAAAMLARCTSESREALGEEVLKMCRSLYNTRQMLPAQVSGSPAGACLFPALCRGQCPLLLGRDMSSGVGRSRAPVSSSHTRTHSAERTLESLPPCFRSQSQGRARLQSLWTLCVSLHVRSKASWHSQGARVGAGRLELGVNLGRPPGRAGPPPPWLFHISHSIVMRLHTSMFILCKHAKTRSPSI